MKLPNFKILRINFPFLTGMLITFTSFSQQTGDITPGGSGKFEKLKADTKGNVYVYQNMYPADYGYLLKFDGTTWKKAGIDSLSWYAVYNYVIDNNANLYLFAAKTKEEKAGIYFGTNGNFTKLPPVASESRIQGIFMNAASELMAYGQFKEGKKEYFMAVWKNDVWIPYHEKIKNKFIANQLEQRNVSKVKTDKNGNLYIHFSKYNFETKNTNNYFAVTNGTDWNILDTVSHNFPNTVRDFDVDAKGNLYVAGFADAKTYCLAKYEDNGWHILLKKGSRIECVEVTESDEVLFAGEFGEGSINSWTQNTESTFAATDGYINEMTLSGNTVYVIAGIGNKYIYRIHKGEKVSKYITKTEPQATVQKPAAEIKDEKAEEVLSITKSLIASYHQNSDLFFKSLKSFFEQDENGNFINKNTWKGQSYFLKQEAAKLSEYLSGYQKQFNALRLTPEQNELNKKMISYLNSLQQWLSGLNNFLDLTQYEIITDELKEAYNSMKKLEGEFGVKEDAINAFIPAYRKRNGL